LAANKTLCFWFPVRNKEILIIQQRRGQMLTRRMSVSLSRVGVSIVSALLITVISLTLLVLNAEAKKVSGGPGCGGDLAQLLGIAANGDTIQVLAGSDWDSNDAVITKDVIIQGGWELVTGTCVSTDTTGFQFVWPVTRSVIFNSQVGPVVRISETVHSLTIQYVDFFNSSGAGGVPGAVINGVISNSAQVWLDNVVIRDSAAITSGGFYLEVRGGSQLILSNVQISGNNADEGGGFEIHVFDNSQVIIQGSQITNNTANGDNGGGGRIVIHKGSVTLANNTFSNNQANFGSGGGVSVEAAGSGPAYLILQNNTFSGNSAATDDDIHISGNITVLDKQIFLPIVRKNS
jgi:hypothetical protein